MNKTVVYDKAKYHCDNFDENFGDEHAFVHTGMFLGWLIDHDLCSDFFNLHFRGYIADFRDREMTGARVFEMCDGILVDEMLTEEGNKFASYYFDFERGRYLIDYEELLCKGLPSIFHVADTWENYEIINRRIDQRYREWKKRNSWNWRSLFR